MAASDRGRHPDAIGRPQAVLLDLLMAVMNSLEIWNSAADGERGIAWRDAVTDRMGAAGVYVSYDALVVEAARDLGLPRTAVPRLREGWDRMRPWPDTVALAGLSLPYAFVTNCSASLARRASALSGLGPRFTLSAEEAGWYKPSAEIYRQACARIGSEPARTLFVAGAAYDARGAQAAGLQAWLVPRRPLARHLHAGIRRLRSLDELAAGIP
jgi:HAD superfamily hydrolase (TIGR01493 family)